uniref:Uncharacterized protein n=1 Tax=Kalanchoe fedtschenkoi TaxID=63787 RepID=A0A7N0ZZQ8_KALFE
MMDPNNGVLDISSDEESDASDQQKNLQLLCDQLFKDADDDSDDVVVVREVFNSKQGVKCLSSPVAEENNIDEDKVQDRDDEEDDCVILDGDPDKMVSVEDTQDNMSDELVVVGEKGQVACRDFPHPRHLCVKYPFSSTLHKFHCEHCHCYVCELVAPCNLWGTGMSIVDHCHATDKQDLWKTERKNFKLKRCSSLPAVKMSVNASSLVPPPVTSEIGNLVRPLTRSITMPNNHVSVHPVPSAHAVRPMPSATAVRPMPSAPAVHPAPTTNLVDPRSGNNRYLQSSVTQQFPSGYTNYTCQKVRYQNTRMLGPQPAVFKRMNTSGAHRPTYRSAYSQPHAPIQSYAPSAAWNQPVNGGSSNRDYRLNKWVNLSSNMNTGPVHDPVPQSQHGNTLCTSAAYQQGTSNRTMAATTSTQNSNQQSNYPLKMTPSFLNASIPWVDNSPSSNSSLPQVIEPLQTEVAPQPNVSVPQTDNTTSRQWHQLPHTEVASNQNVSSLWAGNPNSSQLNLDVLAEALGFQGPDSGNAVSNQCLPVEQSGKGSSLALGSDNLTSAIPELENLHFEFEDWLMENQPVSGNPSEPPLFSEQNILSPEDAHIDANLLYDEWSALASAADM